MGPVRSLPIDVPVFPNETVSSYWRRLCAANHVSERSVWACLREMRPDLPVAPAPYYAPVLVARLGNRAPDVFRDPWHGAIGSNGLFRRRTVARGAAVCRRCAGGDEIYVEGVVGPICLKHRRWHLNGADRDVSDLPVHLAAQRKLNGGMKLLRADYDPSRMRAIRELLSLWSPAEFGTELFRAQIVPDSFPYEVELLLRLTRPEVASVLVRSRVPLPYRAKLVAAIVADVMEHRPEVIHEMVIDPNAVPRHGRWSDLSGYAATLQPRASDLIYRVLMNTVSHIPPAAERRYGHVDLEATRTDRRRLRNTLIRSRRARWFKEMYGAKLEFR